MLPVKQTTRSSSKFWNLISSDIQFKPLHYLGGNHKTKSNLTPRRTYLGDTWKLFSWRYRYTGHCISSLPTITPSESAVAQAKLLQFKIDVKNLHQIVRAVFESHCYPCWWVSPDWLHGQENPGRYQVVLVPPYRWLFTGKTRAIQQRLCRAPIGRWSILGRVETIRLAAIGRTSQAVRNFLSDFNWFGDNFFSSKVSATRGYWVKCRQKLTV